MKKYMFFLFVIYSLNTFSQKQDSIIYIFPDKVEQKLFNQIEKNSNYNNLNFEFYLESIDKDKFRLTFAYSKCKLNNYWTSNTNRFILIKDKKYPLIFDYDSLFSTSNPFEIGEYAKREGTVLKSIFIYEGYNITFDKSGQLIEENYGLYKEKSTK